MKHYTCAFLFRSESKEASPAEQEEGVIPDSLPVVNRLKKQKNNDQMKRVRYAEVPLPQSNNSLFNGQSSLK